MVAGLHIPEEGGWNVKAVTEKFADTPWVLIEWAKRRRGLILRPGLNKKPETLKATRGLRFQARQSLAGSELVLERLLAAEKMTRADLHLIEAVERSETDLAMALADGRADVGLGIEAGARQFKLDFVPLVVERFDLLVWRKAFFDPPFQKLLALAHSEKFADKAKALGGYDLAGFGAVHFNGAKSGFQAKPTSTSEDLITAFTACPTFSPQFLDGFVGDRGRDDMALGVDDDMRCGRAQLDLGDLAVEDVARGNFQIFGDGDEHVGGLDHHLDRLADGEAEVFDRFIGDRRGDDLTFDVNHDMRRGDAHFDFDDVAVKNIACGNFH